MSAGVPAPAGARYRWELALVAVSLIWGSTFVMVQDAVEIAPPLLFLALRFGLATVVLAAGGAFRGASREDWRAGAVIGVALFGGYAFQTAGLQYTSPSNAGFITGLYVPLTPIVATIVLRRLPSASAIAGIALATAGVVLLAMPAGFRIDRGDALIIACAGCFAWQIVLTGRLLPGRSAAALAGAQFATTTVLAAIASAAAERAAPPANATVWIAVAVTGVFASALGYLLQTLAQRVITPTRTAIIFATEPVFAGVFGYLLAGDRLLARGYAGAALILVAILVAEVMAPEREAA